MSPAFIPIGIKRPQEVEMKLTSTGCASVMALTVMALTVMALMAFAVPGSGALAAEGQGCDLRIGPCAPSVTKPNPTPAGGYRGGNGGDQGNKSHNGGGDKPHSTPTSPGPANPPLPNPLPNK